MPLNNEHTTRCGYVALLGAPNAGKSTLLNALLGEKIAIVTPKVQTTRTMLRGIYTIESDQIIFLDTPGLFEAETQFDRMLVGQAYQALDESDVCLFLVDAAKKSNLRDTKKLLSRLNDSIANKPCALVLTKIDLIPRAQLLPLIAQFSELYNFTSIFLVSAEKQDGVKDLINYVRSLLPESPFLYAADDLTDQSLRITAAEFVREQVFLNLHQEIPYGIAVQTVSVDPDPVTSGLIIACDILVAEERHKGMVIGKNGTTLERIGTQARLGLQTALDARINLKLFVKTNTKWRTDRDILQDIGLIGS